MPVYVKHVQPRRGEEQAALMSDSTGRSYVSGDGMHIFQFRRGVPWKTGRSIGGIGNAGKRIRHYSITELYLKLTSPTRICEKEDTESNLDCDERAQVVQDQFTTIINRIDAVIIEGWVIFNCVVQGELGYRRRRRVSEAVIETSRIPNGCTGAATLQLG